jgi:hypothetical protein
MGSGGLWWILVGSGGLWLILVDSRKEKLTVNRVAGTVHRGQFSTRLQRTVKSKHGQCFPSDFQDTLGIAESTCAHAIIFWR